MPSQSISGWSLSCFRDIPETGYYSGIRAFERDSSSSSIDRVWKGPGSLRISSSFRGGISGKFPSSPSLVAICRVLEIFPKRDITPYWELATLTPHGRVVPYCCYLLEPIWPSSLTPVCIPWVEPKYQVFVPCMRNFPAHARPCSEIHYPYSR